MMKLLFSFFSMLTALIAIEGCAVHYFDEKTGAEHIFGMGHMVMKVSAPEDSHQAVVTGTEIIGFGVGKDKEGGYLNLGWDKRRRIEIIDKNTTVDLIWPDDNFLNIRIDSSWPKNDLQQRNLEKGNYE